MPGSPWAVYRHTGGPHRERPTTARAMSTAARADARARAGAISHGPNIWCGPETNIDTQKVASRGRFFIHPLTPDTTSEGVVGEVDVSGFSSSDTASTRSSYYSSG